MTKQTTKKQTIKTGKTVTTKMVAKAPSKAPVKASSVKVPEKAPVATVTTPVQKPTVVAAAPALGVPQKSSKYVPKSAEMKNAARAAAKLENYDFKVGDNAVYPGYGVGKIIAVESKEIMGNKLEFYNMLILDTGLKVMIPKSNTASVGLRPIISKDEANKVISILKETDVKIDNQTWNRRYREYMEKIKTGSVYEIAAVLRDLFLLKVDKELSYGERRMLETARSLLMRELTLAVDKEELSHQDEVKAIFNL